MMNCELQIVNCEGVHLPLSAAPSFFASLFVREQEARCEVRCM
jgi:hypothetical protein